MKIIKRKQSRICPCCEKRFFRKKNELSHKQWDNRIWCSGKCREQKVPIEEYKQNRFRQILTKTIITNLGCMEYQGCLYPSGYAQIRAFGKQESGSRIIWRLIKGEIPEGMCVLHKCDNRKCINPEHLFLGTPQDNMVDKVNKGRQFHKLNQIQKLEILTLIQKGIQYRKIAKIYSVSPMSIVYIAKQNNITRYEKQHCSRSEFFKIKQKILEMLKQDYSYKEISIKLNVKYKYVAHIAVLNK